MKKGLLLCFSWLLLQPILSYAQTDVSEYEALVEDRKYESAWNWLQEKDPDNTNPEIFLLKTDLLTSYFCVSLNHQMFGIKDLEPDEDLMEIRQNMDGSYNMVMFNAEDIGDSLLLIYPDNALVYKAKGNYYYDIYMRYGEGLNYSEHGLLDQAYKSFEHVDELGHEYAFGLYVLGYVELLENDLKSAKDHFIRSIDLDSSFASAHYNLSYIHYMQSEWQQTYNQALISARQYGTDTLYRADAYRVAGMAAFKMEKYDLAQTQLENSLNLLPDHATYYHLISTSFKQKDKKKVKQYTLEKLALDYNDLQSYEELSEVYSANNELPKLVKLFKQVLKKEDHDLTTRVTINLSIANMLDSMEDTKNALKYFKTTRDLAIELLGKDHNLVQDINEVIQELEKGK